MDIQLVKSSIDTIEADLEIIFVVGKNFEKIELAPFKDILELLNFKGESEEGLIESRKVFVGLEDLNHEEIRIGCSKAIKIAKKTKFKTLKVAANSKNLRAMVEGFMLGFYSFDKFKSKKNEIFLEKIYISTNELQSSMQALEYGKITANSVNFVRDIVNMPPEHLTPIKLASIAQDLANSHGLKCEIFDEKFLEEEGLLAFRAVSFGSTKPPRLIHLTYKGENPKAKIAIVGKGLTYDSGGLSLKPSDYMVTMKADKAGGSAVLGILQAISKLELPLEVHGIIGATENMIDGGAYKPDDVLIAKNGKSIEVRNTDAEGRLVLADCLCYAQINDFDYIIDIATLTGACVVALGEYSIGVMGSSDDLKSKILKASKDSGELAVELPFNRYLKKLLKSDIADITNACPTRYGGAITAGLFLSEFIEDKNREKWIHLDIAGPSFIEKEWGYNPIGASGVGVRILLTWLEELATKN